jgi:hypothetical protein
MKKLLTITALFLCSIGVQAQTKGDKWTIDTSAYNTTVITGTLGTALSRSDTIACYFLIAPKIIKDPLHQLPTEWYLGWRINSFSYYLSHLYYNKQPVKEQVLISIPKQ